MKTKIKLLLVMLIFSTAVLADNYIPNGKIINVPRDYATIQTAIDAANPNDMVLVAEGTYYENIRFNGKPITVASRYAVDHIASHISKTIIHGLTHPNSPVAATVRFIDGEDTTSVLNGFTITGGHGVVNETFQRRCGGGVYINNSGCKLLNNIIKENSVTGNKAVGGGICCIMDDAEEHLTIIDSNIIKNNEVISNGHVAAGGGISVYTSSIIRNNVIEFNSCINTVSQAHGGGIYMEELPGNADMSVVKNNTIQDNLIEGVYTTKGAGIAVFYVPVMFSENLISNNSATADGTARGGGVYVYKSPDGIVFSDNRFEENSCTGDYTYGGALMIQECGETDIYNNKFIRNETVAGEFSRGGAVWITQSTDQVTLVENGFIGNQAGDMSFGGALGVYSTDSDGVMLDKNRFVENTAREGAGLWLYNTYDINLCNNVFVRNTANYLGGAIKFNKYTDENKSYSFPEDRLAVTDNSRDFLRPVISNNNFVQNEAFKGGAVCSDMGWNTPVIFNSIFCNNSAFVADDLKTLSDDPFAVYNCLINTEELNTHWTGANNIYCDPLLDGDCTHLCWGSNCANAGEDVLFYDHTWYHCVAYDIDGEERPYAATQPDIGVDETNVMVGEMPVDSEREEMINVYPAPVRSNTTVAFELAESAYVEINIFNTNGSLVETVFSSALPEGTQKLQWNAGNLSPGIYYLKADLGKQSYAKKIVIIK